jgi:hypothetical protein
MTRTKYQRRLEELETHAVLFWPDEIRERVARIDFVERLISTQEKFLNILAVSGRTPESWVTVLMESGLAGNLFLKHLMILSDVAVEALKKIGPLPGAFSGNTMQYIWNNTVFEYNFKAVPGRKIDSGQIFTDTNSLTKDHHLTDEMIDLAMILVFGSTSTNADGFLNVELLAKCSLGQLLGNSDAVEAHAKKHYILVSTQTRGANANARGQAAQEFVFETLNNFLPASEGWILTQGGQIPGIQSRENTETTFDLVITGPDSKQTGVEISFQETTNSTIERKARESQDLFNQLKSGGHALAFILDGAGNIRIRRSASGTICNYSDCTVAFSPQELRHLANFARERSGQTLLE